VDTRSISSRNQHRRASSSPPIPWHSGDLDRSAGSWQLANNANAKDLYKLRFPGTAATSTALLEAGNWQTLPTPKISTTEIPWHSGNLDRSAGSWQLANTANAKDLYN